MGDEPKGNEQKQIAKEEAEKAFPNLAKLFSDKQYVTFSPEQFAEYQNANVKTIESLADKLAVKFAESIRTVAPKTEAVPSSPAGGAGTVKDLTKVAEYFMTNGKAGEGIWTLNKEEYITKWRDNYRRAIFGNILKEAVTTTNVPGITFDRDVLLIPGGQSTINIRPFVNFKLVPDDSDTFHWHKLNKVTFGAITAGNAISEEGLTASRIAGTVTERGALEKISFLQTKTLPVDLVDAVNNAMVAGAIHDEAALVLEEAATATGGGVTAAHWIRGDTGAAITSDDTASVDLNFDGMNVGLRLLEAQGYSRADATAFLAPRAHAELIADMVKTHNVNSSEFNSPVLINGMIEKFLGCKVVVTPAVYLKDNATVDSYRNIIAVPSALGLASKGNIELESDREPENSQIIVTGRHYVDAAVIESTGYVRISTSND